MSGQFVLQLVSVESAGLRHTSRDSKKSSKKRAAEEDAAAKALRADMKKKQKSSVSFRDRVQGVSYEDSHRGA